MPSPLPRGFLARPIAHRALHGPGRPENSREAITSAVEANYGIEIDVQRSADGAAMVFHDYTLARLTGAQGIVQTVSAAELSALPLLGGETGAPTLVEALELVAGRVPLLVEIKDQDGGLGPNVGPLEQEVAQAIKGYEGPLALMSFNPHSVAALAETVPDLPLGLTTCDFIPERWPTIDAARLRELATLPDLAHLPLSFISHDHRALAMPEVAAAKASGLPILTWTIRSEAEASTALEIADQITFEHFSPA
ncbi:MAG: glycerophosphodiester phosphodiesterase family protein [Pseudomonadota bacterium]